MPGLVTMIQELNEVVAPAKTKKVKKVKAASEELDSGVVDDDSSHRLTTKVKKSKKVKKVKVETEPETENVETPIKKTKKRKQEDPDQPKKKKAKKIGKFRFNPWTRLNTYYPIMLTPHM